MATATPSTPPTSTPEWLSKRQGELVASAKPDSYFVMLRGEPQYRLDLRPAMGKHTCVIIQTVNGKRLDNGSIEESKQAALSSGLDQLKAQLRW